MSTVLLEDKGTKPRPSAARSSTTSRSTSPRPTARAAMSSNNILMRSIFQMGIPVSGKNLFPSNIQGLPTWFTIRASREGFIARRRDVGVLICMNPETAHEDVRTVAPGAAVIYEESLNLKSLRDDVHFYPVPFQKLVLELVHDGKLRRLAVNMIYVGVAAWLLDIDMEEIRRAVVKQFKGKEKAVEINQQGDPGGLRLGRPEPDEDRSLPPRADERDGRQDHHRRQRRLGDRRRDGGRQRRRLVPDHAVLLARRVAHRVREAASQGPRDREAHVRDRPGRGRARRRSAWCSAPAGPGRAR